MTLLPLAVRGGLARLNCWSIVLALCCGLSGCGDDTPEPTPPPTQPPSAETVQPQPAGRDEDEDEEPDEAAPAATVTSDEPAADGQEPEAGEAAAEDADGVDLNWLFDREQLAEFSDDGRSLAVSSASRSLRTFDVDAGALSHFFAGPPADITALRIHPERGEVAAGDVSGQVRFLQSGALLGFDEYQQQQLRGDARQRGIGAHSQAVTAMRWRSDGSALATGGLDGTVKLWSVPPAEPVLVGSGDAQVLAISVNEDSNLAAAALSSGQIRIWDLTDQTLLREFESTGATITRLSFVPGQDNLIGTDDTGNVHVWSPVDGRELIRLTGHSGSLTSLSLAKGGTGFLTADDQGGVRQWKLPVAEPVKVATLDAAVKLVRATADQQFAAALVEDRGLILIKLRGTAGILPLAGESGDLLNFEFSKDRSTLAGGTNDGIVRFWSVLSGTMTGELQAHDGPVRSVAMHPREPWVATAGDDGRVQLLALPTEVPAVRRTAEAIRDVAISAGGEWMAVVSSKGDLQIWNLAEGGQPRTYGSTQKKVLSARFSPDGQYLALVTQPDGVQVLNTATLQPVASLSVADARAVNVEFSSNGKTLFAAAGSQLRQIPIDDKATDDNPAVDDVVAFAALSQSAETVVAGADGAVRLLSASDAAARELREAGGEVASIAVTGDDRYVATGQADGSLEVRSIAMPDDVRSWQAGPTPSPVTEIMTMGESRLISKHRDGSVRHWSIGATTDKGIPVDAAVTVASVSPNGQILSVALDNQSIEIRDVTTGKVLKQLPGAESTVNAIGWLPGSDELLTGEVDGTIRLWSVEKAEQLVACSSEDAVTALSVSRNGTQFRSGHSSGVVRQWKLSTDAAEVAADAAEVIVEASEDNAVVALWEMPSNHLLVGHKQGRLDLWELTAARRVDTLRRTGAGDAGVQQLLHVAVSPDRQTVATATADGTVQLFDIESRRVTKLTRTHSQPVVGIEFMSNSLGISLSSDGIAATWTPAGVHGCRWQIGEQASCLNLHRASHRIVTGHAEELRLTDCPLMGAHPSGLTVTRVDGRMTAIADGQTIQLLSHEGTLLQTIDAGHAVSDVAFVGTRPALAIASPDGELTFRSLSAAQFSQTIPDGADALAISASGQWLAASGGDLAVRVWKLETGEEEMLFEGLAARPVRVLFCEQDHRLVVASRDGSIVIYDLVNRKELVRFQFDGEIRDAGCNRTGSIVSVVGVDDTLSILDARDGSLLETIETGTGILCSDLLPDGLSVVAGGADGSVWQREVTGRGFFVAHPDKAVNDAVLLDDYVLSGGADGRVVLHRRDGKLVREFTGHSGVPVGVAAAEAGTRIVALTTEDGGSDLSSWDIGSEQREFSEALTGQAIRLEQSAAENRMVVIGDDNRLHVYDTVSLQLLERVVPIDPATAMASVHGLEALITGTQTGDVWLYPLNLSTVLAGDRDVLTCAAWAPNGAYLAGGGAGGSLRLWDVVTGQVTAELPTDDQVPTAIEFSPDGDLYCSLLDGSVRIWDLADLLETKDRQPHSKFEHAEAVYDVAVSANGQQMATACADSGLRLWDIQSGEELRKFSGHEGAVYRVAFHSEGKLLVSTGQDRSARVWSIGDTGGDGEAAGQMLQSIPIGEDTAQLRSRLLEQIEAARSDEERRRLRRLLRSMSESGNDGSAVARSGAERIEQLRTRLRTANSDRERERTRQELMKAVREDSLRRELAAATTDERRAAIRRELALIRSDEWLESATATPAERLTALDRKLQVADAEGTERTAIKVQFDEALVKTPIWPRTDATRHETDTSHLLSTIETRFAFDSQVFRRVELGVTADGATLVAAREFARLRDKRFVDGVVRVWDVPSGTELRAWTEVDSGRIHQVRFSSTGESIYTIPDMFLFELTTGYSQLVSQDVALTLGPDRQVIALGLRGKSLALGDAVALLDLHSLERRAATFQAYEALVPAVAWSGDGQWLAASLRERTRHRLVLLDPDTLTERGTWEEFQHSAPWLEPKGQAGLIPGLTHLLFSRDNRMLVTYGNYGQRDYRLSVFRVPTGASDTLKQNAPMIDSSSRRPLAFVGRKPWLCMETTEGLKVIDLTSSQVVVDLPVRTGTNSARLIALSDDGTVAAFGNDAGQVAVIRVGRDEQPIHFRAHSGPIVGLEFSQGDRLLVTAGEENRIRIWSLAAFHARQSSGSGTRPSVGSRPRRNR